MAQTPHAREEDFVLKGALLLQARGAATGQPTRDIDLLRRSGPAEAEGGCPHVVGEEDLPTIQKLMRDPEVLAARIAEMFGCLGGHALSLRLARG